MQVLCPGSALPSPPLHPSSLPKAWTSHSRRSHCLQFRSEAVAPQSRSRAMVPARLATPCLPKPWSEPQGRSVAQPKMPPSFLSTGMHSSSPRNQQVTPHQATTTAPAPQRAQLPTCLPQFQGHLSKDIKSLPSLGSPLNTLLPNSLPPCPFLQVIPE